MAIEKSNAQVQTLKVLDDGGVQAKVNVRLADGGTELTKIVLNVTIATAKAAVLAVA